MPTLAEKMPSTLFTWLNRPRMSFLDRLIFTKHLASMMKSGLTIVEAITVLRDQAGSRAVQAMFDQIIKLIQEGQKFSAALAQYENIFEKLYTNMISSGEASGTLTEVLKYLEVQMEKEYELRKKVLAAMVYPTLIFGLTLLLSLGLVIFIMPKMLRVFANFKMELPLPTRILIAVTNFFQNHGLFAFIGAIAIVVLIRMTFRISAVKQGWDRAKLFIPLMGNLVKHVWIARISRTMSSLLASGIPLVRTMTILEETVEHRTYKRSLRIIREQVETGIPLAESLEKFPRLYPKLFTKMIAVGETTGNLEQSAENLADLYEKQVDTETKMLTTLLEPVMLVVMGGLVGGIALSIILPIYKLPQTLQR